MADTDARQVFRPKFVYSQLNDGILIRRDNGIVLKYYYSSSKPLPQDAVPVKDIGFIKRCVLRECEETQQQEKSARFKKELYGIFGQIELPDCQFLILIEEATFLGNILMANVFRVDKLLYVPLNINPTYKASQEALQFIDMIENIQKDKPFYFSYGVDLTKSMQVNIQEAIQQNSSSNQMMGGYANQMVEAMSLYPNAINYIPKFTFNNFLLKDYDSLTLAPFRVPCIFGFAYIRTVQVDKTKFDFALVSKKDCRRPGRRFLVRGIDNEGCVANFVESEHILSYLDEGTIKFTTYIQTRGSIPLLWTQKPTMKYTPAVRVNPNLNDSLPLAQKHLDEMKSVYGETYMINLIDKKGSQLRVGKQFTNLHQSLKDDMIKYTWFDFHHECRKMKYENLAKLLDNFSDKLESYSYFFAKLEYGMEQRDKINNRTCTIISRQSGNFRTNCMDCLDRTNVVQSVISRNIAHRQLYNMGIAGKPSGSPFERFSDQLEEYFRECWTDNANVVSILYTGTPALKTDFTRTGKRTFKGNLNDGYNSVTRYYINNYCDGYNHDCLDLAFGKLTPSAKILKKGFMSPLKLSLVMIFLVLYSLKFFLNIYIPQHDENKAHMIHFLVLSMALFAGIQMIITNGQKFIDDTSRFV